MERAFHLPLAPPRAVRAVSFGAATLEVAELTGDVLRSALAALRARARPGAQGMERRARSLAAAARRLADPADALHRRALEVLPPTTGFSRAMVAERLPHVLAPFTAAALTEIAAGAAQRSVPLVGIVSAGNVPGVALAKAALALTAGSACFVKTAAGEPMLAVLFAEALAAVDADLAGAFGVAWWRGGDEGLEAALLECVGSLVAYGSDPALAALAARSPRPILGHGHKVSIAVVRPDATNAGALAAAAASDVATYDQLGCLSPQAIFTVGPANAARAAFVAALAAALDDLDRRLPLGLVPEADAVAVHRLRDEYEWRAIRGEAVSLQGPPGRFAVIDDPTPGFRPSPLHRTVLVRRIDGIADLASILGAWLPRVESIGVGPWPDPTAAAELAALRVPRIVPLGTMQSPDLAWRQGGLDPTSGIVYEPAGKIPAGAHGESR